MRLNIVIGGRAGQGINLISGIVSKLLASYGYFTFNYRDYPSIIRGGHNFNVLSISDKPIASHESKLDGIIAMDDSTLEIHKKELKKENFTLAPDKYLEFGINLNIALAGALIKILGLNLIELEKEIKKSVKRNPEESLKAAKFGFDSVEKRFSFQKLENKLTILSGSESVCQGAINSGIDLYIAYPMTPATPVMHFLASKQDNSFLVFQPESEIAVANSALGASFAGAKVMVGTSGGGFDLMTEALSLQGQSEIPLVVYLATRAGPATGLPTYTMQDDLNIALKAGHGEFPRIVIAPGTPQEAAETTNQAFYLAQKFNTLSIILSDKHLAESEFSFEDKTEKPIKVGVERKVPGEAIVKATSYEHDELGNTTESGEIAVKNANLRLKKYEDIKKECKKFEMIKIHGKKDSKNIVIGWGSTAGAIIDAIKDLDVKFLQVIYMKPMSDEIKKEMQKAKKIILIENNLTGQLGRALREKTGISIKQRILKYDGRPFLSDELHEQIKEEIKK